MTLFSSFAIKIWLRCSSAVLLVLLLITSEYCRILHWWRLEFNGTLLSPKEYQKNLLAVKKRRLIFTSVPGDEELCSLKNLQHPTHLHVSLMPGSLLRTMAPSTSPYVTSLFCSKVGGGGWNHTSQQGTRKCANSKLCFGSSCFSTLEIKDTCMPEKKHFSKQQ